MSPDTAHKQELGQVHAMNLGRCQQYRYTCQWQNVIWHKKCTFRVIRMRKDEQLILTEITIHVCWDFMNCTKRCAFDRVLGLRCPLSQVSLFNINCVDSLMRGLKGPSMYRACICTTFSQWMGSTYTRNQSNLCQESFTKIKTLMSRQLSDHWSDHLLCLTFFNNQRSYQQTRMPCFWHSRRVYQKPSRRIHKAASGRLFQYATNTLLRPVERVIAWWAHESRIATRSKHHTAVTSQHV